MMATEVGAVIVGAGPAGMAAAMSLVKLGYTKVVVLERGSSVVDVDWMKSYCYNINHHGIKTYRLLGLEEDLARVGVANSKIVRTVRASGKVTDRTTQLGFLSYWVHRGDMMGIMRSKMDSAEIKRGAEIRFESKVVGVVPRDGGKDGFQVSVQPKDGPQYDLVAPLVIGAEGRNSVVEKMMKSLAPDLKRVTVPHINSKRRHKACCLNIPESVIPEVTTGFLVGKDKAKISVYAQRTDKPRSLGVTSWLWCKTAEELLSYVKSNWPQVDWTDVLTPETAAEFVQHGGSVFPEVQYVTRLQVPSGNGGACLVGDAAHMGPPDLGQGVSAALTDVRALHAALAEGKESRRSIADSLAAFEASHQKDAKAIAKLQPLGAPYQYNQPWCLHKAFCTGDMMIRYLGSKYLPSLISQPVIMMLQNPDFTYSEILDAYYTTSRNLMLMAACGVAGCAALYQWGTR